MLKFKKKQFILPICDFKAESDDFQNDNKNLEVINVEKVYIFVELTDSCILRKRFNKKKTQKTLRLNI